MDPFGGRFFQWGNDDKPWGNDDKPCNFNAALTKKASMAKQVHSYKTEKGLP